MTERDSLKANTASVCCTLQFRHTGLGTPRERGRESEREQGREREGEREEREQQNSQQERREEGGGDRSFFRFFNSSDFGGVLPTPNPCTPILAPPFLQFTQVPFCSPGSTDG